MQKKKKKRSLQGIGKKGEEGNQVGGKNKRLDREKGKGHDLASFDMEVQKEKAMERKGISNEKHEVLEEGSK